MHTLLIVDDEEIEREGIAQFIRDRGRLEIIKERQIVRFGVQYLVHLQGLEPWAH